MHRENIMVHWVRFVDQRPANVIGAFCWFNQPVGRDGREAAAGGNWYLILDGFGIPSKRVVVDIWN